jgi:HEAT repeat protein
MRTNRFYTVILICLNASVVVAAQIEPAKVRTLVNQYDAQTLKGYGREILPVLVKLYEQSPNEDERGNIATMFYQLGWKSEEAKRVLMKDVQTQNQLLRLRVQYALGRVSNDTDVVDVLLSNMQNDPNPLFRDKAACALTYDQIHLTEQQKVRLYEGLIRALRDPKLQVRQIALLSLKIRTGQTKGFSPTAAEPARESSIKEWEKWLQEYRSNL